MSKTNNTGMDIYYQTKAIHCLEGIKLNAETRNILLKLSVGEINKEEADQAFYDLVNFETTEY